jgi:hypothetical protein
VYSLIFTNGLSEDSTSDSHTETPLSRAVDQTLEGLWWKQENNVTGFVALSNTTLQPLAATLQVSDAQANPLGHHLVTVSPHGTKLISLNELQDRWMARVACRYISKVCQGTSLSLAV